MKILTFFIGLLLTFNNLVAQKTVTKNYNTNGILKVNFNFKFAENIKIKNWKKPQIQVIAEVNLNDNKDNDKFVLQQDKIGETLKINSNYKDLFKKHKYSNVITRGKEGKKTVQNCGTKVVVNYTVYVPKNLDIKVKSISGNVEINELNNNVKLDLVSGNIDIKKHSKKMDLKTVSGDIDVVVKDAEFMAKTVTGTLYSNLDIEFEKREKINYGNKLSGIVSNGNARLQLTTVSGDVLLRKQ